VSCNLFFPSIAPLRFGLLLLMVCLSYCADLVQKRLHKDVMPLIDAMRAGFNLVSHQTLLATSTCPCRGFSPLAAQFLF
jgi:hypothetical protein